MLHRLVRCDRLQPVLFEESRKFGGRRVWQAGELDCSIASLGDGLETSAQVHSGKPPNRVELEGDLVSTHRVTIGHPAFGSAGAGRSVANSFLTNASSGDAQAACG